MRYPTGPLARRVKLGAIAISLAITASAPSTPFPGVFGSREKRDPLRPCALPAVHGVSMSEGFPAGRGGYARATGRVRALTLFVSFRGAPAPGSPRTRYHEFFPRVQDWFRTSSYGRLSYETRPVLKYFRLPRSFHDYRIRRGYPWQTHTEMMRDLLSVADAEVDFRGYDLVNVLTAPNVGDWPATSGLSVTWTGASAATSDEGVHLDRVSVIYGHDPAGYRLLNHENGHSFGLPDLYSSADFEQTDGWAGQWDVMSLPRGARTDVFAWHKWRLGWLDDTQVDCVTGPGRSEHTLTAVEVPGGTKAVVIPTSETRALVAEARNAVPAGAPGCSGGVLVYRVRTDVPSGEGPVRVVDANPRNGPCGRTDPAFSSLNDAPFAPGQRYRSPGGATEVAVTASDQAGRYRIRVTRR